MKIAIRHELTLSTAAGGSRSVQHLLLTPVSGPGQTVTRWSIAMPGIDEAARFTDAFGNKAVLTAQAKPEGPLTIVAEGEVETIDRNGVLGRVVGDPVVALYRRTTPLTPADPALIEGLADDRGGRIALLHEVMRRVRAKYLPDDEADEQTQSQDGQSQSQGVEAKAPAPADTDPAELTHAFIGTLRKLGIAARFVTGYVLADDDFPAHFGCWAEAYDEGLGWIGFDPLLGVCPTDRHVRVAAGLDALSTAAVRVVPPEAEPAPGSGRVEISAQ